MSEFSPGFAGRCPLSGWRKATQTFTGTLFDPGNIGKFGESKAAQLKAQQELAKKAAGKTNGLDGYQQNILARQKQQEAAAKRKKAQQELAKKELNKSQVHIPTGYELNMAARQNKKLIDTGSTNAYVRQKNSLTGTVGSKRLQSPLIRNEYLKAAFADCFSRSIANKKSCEADAGRINTTWNKMGILQEGIREVLISQGKTGWLRAADIGEGTKKLVAGGVAYVALADATGPVSKYLGGTVIADYMAGGFKQM